MLAWRGSAMPGIGRNTVITVLLVMAVAGAAAAAPLLSDNQAKTALAMLSQAAAEGLDPGSYRVMDYQDPAARNAAIIVPLLAYIRDERTGRPGLESLDP